MHYGFILFLAQRIEADAPRASSVSEPDKIWYYRKMDLCSPATVQAITAARESVELYLRNTFEEIGRLQHAEDFLQKVDAIQQRTRDLDTWKVQREQLVAVEQCATTCTCDEGAKLVLAEYNTLARQEAETSGLVAVPLAQPASKQMGMVIALAIAIMLAAYFLRRRKRRV